MKERKPFSPYDLGVAILTNAPEGAKVSSFSELDRFGAVLRVAHLNGFRERGDRSSAARCASDIIDWYKRERDQDFPNLSQSEAHRQLVRRLRACLGSEEARLLVIPGIARANSEETRFDSNAAGYVAFIDTPSNTWTMVIGIDPRGTSEIEIITSSTSISVQKMVKPRKPSFHDE